MLTSGLEGRLNDLRHGRSRVVEAGHTVILGWSPQVFTIVSELAFANRQRREDRGSSQTGHNACVTILADRDKVEMEEEIRTKVPDTLGTRVVCRSGSPLDLDDLLIVSPHGTARDHRPFARRSVPRPAGRQDADGPGQRSRPPRHRYHIVAELHRPTNLQLARLIGGDEAEIFLVDGLIARLIAQTCRQSGLSVVYAELFSFEGAAIHFHEASSLVGITYGEALFRVSECDTDRTPVRGWASPDQPADGDHDPARTTK